MKRQYRKLATYNRIRVLKQVKNILEKDYGAKILHSIFDKPLEIKCYTMETSPLYKDKIEAIENLPIIETDSEHLYLEFLYQDYYFSFSFDDNPFFPIHYEKIKVNENGEYIGRRYIETTDDRMPDTLDIHLAYDDLFKIIDDEKVNEIAKAFLESIDNYIKNGHENERYKERKRVPNYYNSSYHYETIYDTVKCCIYNENTNGGNGQYVRKD